MKGNSPFERISMNTGLSGFSLLSRIGEFSGEGIDAWADLQNAPSYLGVEALAQAGAYHVRFLCSFERQAVLLVIRDCRLPAAGTLSGRCQLTGRLRSRSASAFAYGMSATIGGVKVLEGEFVFSAAPYNSELREDLLKGYYEKKWKDLMNG